MRALYFMSGMGISMAAAGCLGGTPEPAAASQTSALFVASGNIWGRLNIPVCFENASDNNATGRAWVEQAVSAAWQAHSKVNFAGWGKCASDADGIRIVIEDTSDAPHTVALGRDLNGEENGMSLNFAFHNWNTVCADASARESCIKSIAVHEFGHALGFSHEQNRDDTPASCDQAQGEDGDTTVGAWDVNSVMNYCNPIWNNGGNLSATDIRGLQAYYGSPDAGSMRIAAVNLGQGKFYTFRGGLYSRLDDGSRVMDSGYPRSIADNWGNWPSTWTDGIDAALNWDGVHAYFFRGSQYVKVDIASKTVLAGYPRTTATSWGNWPAGWTSVDAAIDWGNGKYYFFRGDQYVRYDKSNDSVDAGYPKTIADHWPGLFTSNIASAFNDGDGKAYFFKGNVYDRVDIADGEHDIDAGYPANIVGNWPGVLF